MDLQKYMVKIKYPDKIEYSTITPKAQREYFWIFNSESSPTSVSLLKYAVQQRCIQTEQMSVN